MPVVASGFGFGPTSGQVAALQAELDATQVDVAAAQAAADAAQADVDAVLADPVMTMTSESPAGTLKVTGALSSTGSMTPFVDVP